MKQVGDVYWDQLSIWEFSPEECIEGYRKVGEHVFHYVLKEVIKVTSHNNWKVAYTLDKNKIPKNPVMDEIYLNTNDSRIKIN